MDKITDPPTLWSGGNDGTLFAIPVSVIPENPSLSLQLAVDAGVEGLNMVLFGSPEGAARTLGPPAGADWLPVLDSHAIPGSAGSLVAPASAGALTHTVEGTGKGSYSQAVTGPGFAAAVKGLHTAAGVTDKLTGNPKERSVRFAGEQKRRLTLDLATELKGGIHRSASVRTRSFEHGSEKVALRGGSSLAYVHRGQTTSFSFDLSNLVSGKERLPILL